MPIKRLSGRSSARLLQDLTTAQALALISSIDPKKCAIPTISANSSCRSCFTVIRLGKEANGAPISREIEDCTGRDVAFATVYSTLQRLQKKGLVRTDLGDPMPERGGRAKRYFQVTKAGLQAVRKPSAT
jgi:hypothetical protein